MAITAEYDGLVFEWSLLFPLCVLRAVVQVRGCGCERVKCVVGRRRLPSLLGSELPLVTDRARPTRADQSTRGRRGCEKESSRTLGFKRNVCSLRCIRNVKFQKGCGQRASGEASSSWQQACGAEHVSVCACRCSLSRVVRASSIHPFCPAKITSRTWGSQ